MTRTGSMQLAKIQTTGILRVEWPAGMEGESGDYKIRKWQVSIKERGRGWWVKMYARVIKPERHSRMRYKENSVTLMVVVKQGRGVIGWMVIFLFSA